MRRPSAGFLLVAIVSILRPAELSMRRVVSGGRVYRGMRASGGVVVLINTTVYSGETIVDRWRRQSEDSESRVIVQF